MYILINDKMQESNIIGALISPALADVYEGSLPVPVDLGSSELIDCVGIGYTDATTITITAGAETRNITFTENGLYLIEPITAQNIEIDHDGTYIGRVALGEKRRWGLSPQREPGFYTTNQSRITAAGQVIEGAGGYSGRKFGFDVRYKIDEDSYNDFESAYPGQLSKNFPVFIDVEDKGRYPIRLFYGRFKRSDFVFQSSITRFLYSRRFELWEAF